MLTPKSPRFNKDALIEITNELNNLDLPSKQQNKYYVKVGNQYGMRDPKSPSRYSLTNSPIYFFRETEARECLRVLSLKFKVELIIEAAPNN